MEKLHLTHWALFSLHFHFKIVIKCFWSLEFLEELFWSGKAEFTARLSFDSRTVYQRHPWYTLYWKWGLLNSAKKRWNGPCGNNSNYRWQHCATPTQSYIPPLKLNILLLQLKLWFSYLHNNLVNQMYVSIGALYIGPHHPGDNAIIWHCSHYLWKRIP